jgi:hypothetical protein
MPSISSTPGGGAKSTVVRRSRARRAGESAFGMLLLLRNMLLALITLVLLSAGVWQSWDTAWPAITGHQRGTVKITSCRGDDCTGPFTASTGARGGLDKARIAESVSGHTGRTIEVARRPGTTRVVRTGPAGVLYGCVPFGGAMLLASVVVAGGLRMRRTGLTLGLLGAAVMAGAWGLLSF